MTPLRFEPPNPPRSRWNAIEIERSQQAIVPARLAFATDRPRKATESRNVGDDSKSRSRYEGDDLGDDFYPLPQSGHILI